MGRDEFLDGGREGIRRAAAPCRRRSRSRRGRWPTSTAMSASIAQKQPGLNYVGVVLPVGRMTSEQMRGLAEIAERFGSGTIRLTVWQNLLISDIADEDVGVCIAAIEALGLGVEASADPARPGRLHRQCRLQVRRLQHQGPCAAARRLSRSARRARPADQHPPHRLPSLLRPALYRRHRPAGHQGRASARRASRAITSMSAAARPRPPSRRWRASMPAPSRSTNCRRCSRSCWRAWLAHRAARMRSFFEFCRRHEIEALRELAARAPLRALAA